MTDAPVVVISGQVAAGKTTAAKMLATRGLQYARISQAIKKLCWPSNRGETPPRSWYQQMGRELHHTLGQRALCQETMSFIARPSAPFVIDGARWKEDVAFFRDKYGDRVVHIHLAAPVAVRRRRFKARDKDVSFEAADRDEVESEVPDLESGADYVFTNDVDDEERLKAFLDNALRGQGYAS